MMMSAIVSLGQDLVRNEGDRTVDGSHDESDLHGVGGAGEVGVDLLVLVLVEGHEAV
jgi:hypothetical protein